jgi:hypothetical protein
VSTKTNPRRASGAARPSKADRLTALAALADLSPACATCHYPVREYPSGWQHVYDTLASRTHDASPEAR